MARPGVFVTAALAFGLVGCSTGGDSGDPDPTDPSLVLNRQPAPNPNVENGTAYDRAAVDVGAGRTVVLPDTATVRRDPAGGPVRLFMAKQLLFVGHPPAPMSIRDSRKNMGCAIRTEGDALVIATFGEWDSHIEGGAGMRLVAFVPEGVGVQRRDGLSGEKSAAREQHGAYVARPEDAKGGHWYGPASPAPGWTAVPDEPDPDRTAR
ncbi:MAG TPA: hypothetical protein VKD90_10265 [Gemmataceae bacterium]|nr:hypothetical protein [Gemmataceae bacterium]